MENKSQKLLNSMLKYYNNGTNLLKVIEITENTFENKISLRLIDWLVTNYSKSHNIIYKLNEAPFNMHQSYKDMLKAYSKKMFDPFRRHDRINIDCPHLGIYKFTTTVAQLTFFRWAIESKIIDYAILHKDDIKKDMDINTKHRQVKKIGKKRQELSKSISKSANIYSFPIQVKF